MKIKICYVISSLSNQGPPNVLFNILRYMDFDIFEVSIVTLVEEKKESRLQDFKSFPIRIFQLYPRGEKNPFSMYLSLRKVVLSLNPDIIHTHCPRSMFLVPFLPNRFIKIETVHIYPGLQQKVMYGLIKGSIVIWLSHFFTMRMDVPIACSESVAETYLREKNYKMKAIPNGSSLPIWKYDEGQKSQIRILLNLRKDIKYFIFVGRFSQEKNPDMIIQAIKRIKTRNVGLIMLGSGPMYEELKKNAKDTILFPGFQPNVYDYLIAADYYISTSDVEGLANTVLESMTVGLPMVLSDIPSHHEIISKTKIVTSFICNQHNVDSIVDGIDKVLTLDTVKVKAELNRVFESYYTAKKMSFDYQSLYKKVSKSNSDVPLSPEIHR